MSNSTTLAQLREMAAPEVARLPIDHLAMLLEDVAAQKADTKQLDDKLHDALDHRYSGRAATLRRESNKDTGRVSLMDGDFIIRADLPKKVSWDTTKLEAAVETVRSWGEPITEYVTVKLVVPESKFTAWPATVRSVFEPARTVGTGPASYVVERRVA